MNTLEENKEIAGLGSNKPEPSANLQSFNWRDYGKTTSVKEQKNPICWSYGTIAGVEHNLLRKGIIENRDQLDLNEWNFAYHSWYRNEGADILGNTDYDLRNYEDRFKEWTRGYDAKKASYTLLQWNSLQDQTWDFHNYQNYNHDSKFKTTDVVWLDKNNRTEIKEAIVKYGSVVFTYVPISNDNSKYFNNPKGENHPRSWNTGHIATIVGWDDSISKDNFDEKPNSDGAFLVKNSWGDDWGDQGYFWLSYETLIRNTFSVDVEKGDKYDFNYYYDGLFGDTDMVIKNSNKAAVLFRARKGDENKVESLKAINVGLKGAKGGKLHVKVYKNLGYDFKTIDSKHTPVLTKTYDINNEGFISFELEGDGVELEKNKSFAITVESDKGEILFSHEPESANDFSYYYSDNNTWKNSLVEYKSAARIKAWTKLKDKEVKTESTLDQSKDIKNADVSFKENSYRWGDSVGKPIIEYNKALLKEGKDYTLAFSNNFDSKERYHSDNAVLNGNGLITITGTGEYKGQVEIPYFYKVGLRPNFNSLNGKVNFYGNSASFQENFKNSNWELTPGGTYLNYVGHDSNHYRKTNFSIDEVRKFMEEDKERIEEIIKPIQLEQEELIVPEAEVIQVQKEHEVADVTEEVDIPATVTTSITTEFTVEPEPVTPVEVPEVVVPVGIPTHTVNSSENTTTNPSVSYRGENNNLIVGLAGGGGAALGLFVLIPVIFRKRYF